MFVNFQFVFVALSLFAATETVLGREHWLERDNRPVYVRFARRRFGQENPPAVQKLQSLAGCPGQICGTLAGGAIAPLLAAADECAQQDHADAIIDAAQQFDGNLKAQMIEIAIEYRQAEKNTPPGFDTNPPTLRNSVFCQKAPKNPELNGLVQAQDPANDPNLFFDPVTKTTIQKGSQANTAPFGGAAANPVNNDNIGNQNENTGNEENTGNQGGNNGNENTGNENTGNGNTGVDCPPNVTVTAGAPAATETAAAGNQNNNGNQNTGAGNIGDFGICTTPEIEFAAGFDNRKETSFQPVDKTSFDHGSAQNIDIITRAICDTLTNKCQADQTAKDTCQQAAAAASAATKGSGAQADAFNAVFGIQTNFVDVPSVDNQGNVIAGTGSSNLNNGNNSNTGNNGNTGANNGGSNQNGNGNGADDFGECTVPEIEFAAGFDNRKETSFRPANLDSFNHGSAQNIDIITRFICDTLTNKCKANQAAKDTCQQAAAAASAATKGSGAQADAFNAVFGIQTNFVNVPSIDNQGNVVSAKRGLRRRRGVSASL